jgi:hypothetical protein
MMVRLSVNTDAFLNTATTTFFIKVIHRTFTDC